MNIYVLAFAQFIANVDFTYFYLLVDLVFKKDSFQGNVPVQNI